VTAARETVTEGAAARARHESTRLRRAERVARYRPAINSGSAKPDLDGNVWIRTSATRAGSIAGPIYDVVNRKGELVDRIQVPSGRTIVGFGKRGVVYMMARDDKAAWLERTKR
jgi:hypothetical protein